jgi:hypothetical protein
MGALGAIQFTGITQLMVLLRKLRGADFGEAWVGSAVVYGPFQEFGTKVLQERPHWRVAIPEIIAMVGQDEGLQGAVVDGLVGDGDPAPIRIALMIERRVKEIIQAKGIIDTGNYRASIATGRTEKEAFDESASKSRPGTVQEGSF